MAITASYCKRNDAVKLTKNTADATFSIGLGDKPGEKVVILVENNNTTAGCTATLEVLAGDYLANVYGTMSVDVANSSAAVIGPVETVRYKNTASEIDCACAVTGSDATLTNVKIAVIKLP